MLYRRWPFALRLLASRLWPPICPPAKRRGASQTSAQFNGHIIRAGLNYDFNSFAPAPVVAKY
jgi:hypothetical protein